MKSARSLFLAAAATALLVTACSQPADLQTPGLEAQFGTADIDNGVDVALAPAGGSYALSEQKGSSPNPNYDLYYKVLLRRYDNAGAQVWIRDVASLDVGGSSQEYLRARVIKNDASGDSYVLFAEGDVEQDSRNANNYNVYRYGADGSLKRSFAVGTTRWDFTSSEAIPDMALDGNGNTYVAIQDSTTDEDDGLAFYTTNLLRKYGSTGSLVWERTSSVGVLTGVASSTDGGGYVAGRSGLARYNSSGTLLWKKSGFYNGVAVSGSSVFAHNKNTVYRFSGSGQQQGSTFIGSLNSVNIQDLSSDAAGGVLVSGKYVAGSGNWNAFVRKLSATGSSQWTSTFGTPSYDDAQGVVEVSTREAYVTGTTLGSLAGPNQGEEDGYVRKLGAGGKPIWTR